MKIIAAILALSKMADLFDKWLEKFTLMYIEQKRKADHVEFLKALEKSKTGDVTDLASNLGKHL
jgi:hypothetical protein